MNKTCTFTGNIPSGVPACNKPIEKYLRDIKFPGLDNAIEAANKFEPGGFVNKEGIHIHKGNVDLSEKIINSESKIPAGTYKCNADKDIRIAFIPREDWLTTNIETLEFHSLKPKPMKPKTRKQLQEEVDALKATMKDQKEYYESSHRRMCGPVTQMEKDQAKKISQLTEENNRNKKVIDFILLRTR